MSFIATILTLILTIFPFGMGEDGSSIRGLDLFLDDYVDAGELNAPADENLDGPGLAPRTGGSADVRG